MNKIWRKGLETEPLLFRSRDGLVLRKVNDRCFKLMSENGDALATFAINDGSAEVLDGDARLFPGRKPIAGCTGARKMVVEDDYFTVVLATGRSASIAFRPYDTELMGLIEQMVMGTVGRIALAAAVGMPVLLAGLSWTSLYYGPSPSDAGVVESFVEEALQQGERP